jgi:hypothetical protein
LPSAGAKGEAPKVAGSTASALSQIGSGRRSGGDNDDVDAKQHQFAAQAFGKAFQTKLRGRVGTHEGKRAAAGGRRHHDDATLARNARGCCAQQWREALRDEHLADEVDLELAAQLGDRDLEQRPRDGYPRVIDEAGERLALELGAHLGRGGGDCRRVRDIAVNGCEEAAQFRAQLLAVGLPAHATEDAKAPGAERARRGSADARGGSGHHDGARALSKTSLFNCHRPLA